MDEVEASFTCPKCKGTPYRLYRRQVTPGSDVYVHDLRAGPDGEIDIPDDRTNLQCLNCNVPLERK